MIVSCYLRTIIRPGQFLVSGASCKGGESRAPEVPVVLLKLFVLFCIIPGSVEAKTEQRYSVLLN